MSTLASLILLPQTVYVNDGTSQPMQVDGVPAKAAAYYLSNKYLQTVSYQITNFVGKLVIQATLENDIETTTWFDVSEVVSVSPLSEIRYLNIEGNFVYIRVIVRNFTNGEINYVRLAY